MLTIEILAVILSLRLLDFHLEGDQMMERKQIFYFLFLIYVNLGFYKFVLFF